MKRLFLTILLLMSITTLAHADWTKDFSGIYQEKGIDAAVAQALKEGATPKAILDEGLKIEGLNAQNLLKALYCAGIDGKDIKKAALEEEISEMLIVAAYEKSVAECGDKVVDTQAYTPVGTAPSFAGMPSPGSLGGSTYASPSTF